MKASNVLIACLVFCNLPVAAALAAPPVPIPFVFEQNAGQVDKQVRFFGRAPGAALWLTDSGAVLSVQRGDRRAVLRMRLKGARPHPGIEGTELLPGKSNYFTGRDPAQWRHDISQYAAVRYHEVYPGIDLVFHASSQIIEYDWVVAPGADPRAIRMSFEGARETHIDSTGDLVLRVGDVDVREKRPHIYQDGGAQEIAGRFVQRGHAIGFDVAEYDPSRALTIDPILTYATVLGGNGNAKNQLGDVGEGVVMDAQGNAIVIGYTASQNFPTKSGAYVDGGALINAVVAKVNPSGPVGSASLVWSTYLGGSRQTTQGYGVALDSLGNVYITGATQAPDFPLKNPFQTSFNATSSCTDSEGNKGICFLAFVTKLDAAGNELIYSSYLGGTAGENFAYAIAVDSSGSVWVTGEAQGGFPLVGNSIPTSPGSDHYGFISKVSPDGSELLYSTYLGALTTLQGIAVDSLGNAYVTGYTYSPTFPVANAYQASLPAPSGLRSGVVAELNPGVEPSLVYSTYLGGTDEGGLLNAIAVDSHRNIFVGGRSAAITFPVTANAVQTAAALGPSGNTGTGAVIAELNPAAESSAQLEYSTFLTGSLLDEVDAIALDNNGHIVVGGWTESFTFPTTPDAFQPYYRGEIVDGVFPNKSFLSIIDPTVAGLKGLIYSTLYGGTFSETLAGMALDATATHAAITGTATSPDLFVTPSAYQLGLTNKYSNAFVAVFDLSQTGPTISAIVNAASFAPPKGNFAPGEIVTLFGSNLGPQTLAGAQLDQTGHLASTLAGCQLLVNRIPAPLVYVQANQAAAILPYELTPLINGNLINYAQMVCNGVGGNVFEFSAVAAAPGIFSATQSGMGQAAVLNQDGSYNSASNPAAMGSIVQIFATGEGVLMNPAGQDGRIETGGLSTIPTPMLPVTVTFGTTPSPNLTYAGVAPGEVDGLLQVNAQVPTGLTPGNVPLVLGIGSFSSPSGLTIAVK